MPVPSILVVDDDRSLRELLQMHLEERGLAVEVAGTGAEGEKLAREKRPQVIVLDVHLPDRSGLDLLEALRQTTDAPVLVVTAFHDMATTILAMKSGAFDYIRKPIDLFAFDAALDRALEERRVSSSAKTLQLGDSASPDLHALVGNSPPMQEIFKEVGKIASSKATVLLKGDSGTGKELLARVIHRYSAPSRPFVAVNCAAIVETLLESELFGHERGAFTGAVAQKPGKCELAEDGTLFLDEIGDLPLSLQAKLLRVLQEREFERVGGVKRLPLRARVIAATHHDLGQRAGERLFRDDLYQRLKVVTLELPPLRERAEDVPLLVGHLLRRINERTGRKVTKVPPEVMAELKRRPWPGNVRELENALLRAVVMAPGDVLLPELIGTSPAPGPPAMEGSGAPLPPGEAVWTLEEIERAHIERVLAATGGHRGKACEVLGITRPTLERKLRKYHLAVPRRTRART